MTKNIKDIMAIMMKMILMKIQTPVPQKAIKKAIIWMMMMIIMLVMKKTRIKQTRNKKRMESVFI